MAYRKDRDITSDIPSYRRMLAHVTPSRDQASVFFAQTLDVTRTLEWIAAHRERTGKKMSFLAVWMAAAGRMLHKRPQLNRYVQGWRFFQRDGVFITVSAKKELRDGAKVVLLKVPMQPDDTPDTVLDRLQEMLGEGRSTKIQQEKEHDFFAKFPGFVLNPIVRLAMWADRRHWLPGFLVDPDPLYTSLVVANLGSVGLDAAYHHLYEWGNSPFFAVIGRITDGFVAVDGQPVLRKLVEIRYTFDERVDDGLATAISLAGLKKLVENPERFYEEEGARAGDGDRPPDRVSAT